MSTGGVEVSGTANSGAENDARLSEKINDGPDKSRVIDPDEPIGDDGVNFDVYADSAENEKGEEKELDFSSEDIDKRKKTDFFVNVAGAEKRARQEKRESEKATKRRIAEASKKDRREKRQQNKEESQRLKDAKRTAGKMKREKLRAALWRLRFVIIAAIAAAAIAVVAVIITPIISENLRVAHRESVIQNERTDMQALFLELTGKSIKKSELDKKYKVLGKEAFIEYGEIDGSIYLNGTTEHIRFTINNDVAMNFAYYDNLGEKIVFISEVVGAPTYFDGDESKEFDSVEDALLEYLTDKNKEKDSE